MRIFHSTALLLATLVAVASPALAQNVTPQQAQALLQQRPDLAAQVRQQVGTSGLTPAQLRDRLSAQGYDPSLLDPYMGGTGGNAPTPGNDVLSAMRALGISDDSTFATPANARYRPARYPEAPIDTAAARKKERERIFGLDMFRSTTSQFLPNLDGPVDSEYQLGPGDELVLILTGDVELVHTLQVTREGFVVIPQVGQLSVANLSLAQLDNVLYARLGKVYSGIRRGADATTHFSVSVARLRSVQVFVTGDVMAPGSYRVSSAGTALTALYAAGGPSDRGSLRRVELRRGGKVVSSLDVYDYLLKGDASHDLRLRSGDVIFVGVHGPHVRIDGEITRPATYEMLGTETLADLVSAAGGYTPTASERRLSIERIVPAERRQPGGRDRAVIDVSLDATPTIGLEAGDIVRVRRVADRLRGRIVVAGQVWQPDTIGIGSGLTLSQALRRAGGLKPDALLGNVLVSRLRDDSTRVQLRAEVRDTSGAVNNDLALQEDDEITVFSRTEFRIPRYVVITGAVKHSGRLRWREGMTLRDLALQAGGLAEGASVEFAEIARLPEVHAEGELARTERVAIDSSYLFDEGLRRGTAPEVPLQPYDNVLFFRRPDWELPRVVSITGEVKYPGNYTLKSKSESISDLVQRAGGLTRDANSDAAWFSRLRVAASYRAAADMMRDSSRAAADSLRGTARTAVDSLRAPVRTVIDLPRGAMRTTGDSLRGTARIATDSSTRIRIGIDLGVALRDAQATDNLLLQAGDSLAIPPHRQTVEIRGEVNSPTATALARGKSLGYYMRAGGGPTSNADIDRVYVVQPSGKVESRRRYLWFINYDPTPRAGATVVVPVRDMTSNQTSFITMVSTFAQLIGSLATVWVLVKK